MVAFSAYAAVTVVVSLVACVDPEGSGVHNRLTRFLYEFPEAVAWPVVHFVLGPRAQKRAAAFVHWLCEEPNCVLQSVYLMIVVGGYGCVVACAYPRVPCAHLVRGGASGPRGALRGKC